MITDVLAQALVNSFEALEIELELDEIQMERPASRTHGDWSSIVALVRAKQMGHVPRELAETLVRSMQEARIELVDKMEVAGPGFINFFLSPKWLHQVMIDVLELGEARYARSVIGEGKSVNLEFVSANPTGPLHAGGGRWGAYGDSLARIFRRCGYATTTCLLYTSPSPRDKRQSRMPSSA